MNEPRKPRAAVHLTTLRVASLLLLAGVLAGCDKCGNRVKLNAPTLPDSCGANAEPLR